MFALLASAAGAASCANTSHEQELTPRARSAGPGGSTNPIDPSEDELATIATNTQATIENVKIGAGNFNTPDTYTDERGEERRGNTAGLWIFVLEGNGAETRSTLRVHAGQTFEAGGQRFEVKEVRDRSVVLRRAGAKT